MSIRLWTVAVGETPTPQTELWTSQTTLLTILIFLPTVGAVLTMLVARAATPSAGRRWEPALSPSCSRCCLFAYLRLAAKAGGYAYASRRRHRADWCSERSWIPAFNIQYKVGIDGLSFPLVILSTFICLLACVASWNIEKMPKGYMALFLFLETGILGVFLSLDFFLFYVFFEVVAAADVFPDRHLGRAAEGICGDQVLPLYAGRLDRPADRADRHVSLQHRAPVARRARSTWSSSRRPARCRPTRPSRAARRRDDVLSSC